MKRIGLILIAVLLLAFPLFSQNVSIPDTAFLYALIEEGVDTNGDGEISYSEAESVTHLDVSGEGITDLSGIEAFVNLGDLTCSNNQLTSLDVTGCASLTRLSCAGNQLSSLDVSNNTALEGLYCNENQLTTLDVSKNTELKTLACGKNKLSNLDISKNIKLFSDMGLWDGRLDLSKMRTLYEVCVWEMPFPPTARNRVDTKGSPNVIFTTDCMQ